jgi:AraC family transcriptional regulator
MSVQHAAIVPHSAGLGQPIPTAEERAWRRIGVHVDARTTLPGTVELDAGVDHLLRIHAGAPVRGGCRSERFFYARGDIDLFPAGASDVWAEEQANTSLIVRLAPSLLRRAAEDLGLDPDRAGLAPRHQFRDPQIEYIAWALDAERTDGHSSGLLYAESLGLALAVRLLGRYPALRQVQAGLVASQLRRVTEYIEAHLDRDLSLARLAGVAGVSASHLKSAFRRATGLPVHAYVVQRRVERARELLVRGELPASQVALEAGFAHQSHMARWMRRLLGVTPTAVVHGTRGR